MNRLVYTGLICLLFALSCKKEKVESFFNYDPPISPITKTIKTTTAIGYCATLSMAYFKGYSIPNAIINNNGSTTIFYVNLDGNYPFGNSRDYFSELIVLASRISEDVAILTIFFTDTDIGVGNFTLMNVRTIPVIWDEEKITAIYASQDINFGSDTLMDITLTNEEISFELSRFSIQRTSDEQVAIDQNAWIIDVYHQNTLENMYDDNYVLYGGEQNVQLCYADEIPESSMLQMAIIGAEISPDCIKNPNEGVVFMQNAMVSEDVVLGHVFLHFPDDCAGKALVIAATGSYLLSSGKKYDLNLD